jgi:hypothetical protein
VIEERVDSAARERCIRSNVMTAAMMLKCLLSRQRAGRSTVEIASRNVEEINSGYRITQFINLPIFFIISAADFRSNCIWRSLSARAS